MEGREENVPVDDLSIEALRTRLKHAHARIRQQNAAIRANQRKIYSLGSSQKELGSVLRTAQHAFLAIGADDTIRHANPVFRTLSNQLFGRVPEAGDPVHDFVRPQDMETFNQNLSRAREGETIEVVRSFSYAGEGEGQTWWFRFLYAPVSWETDSWTSETSALPLSEEMGETLELPDSILPDPEHEEEAHLVLLHIEDITQQHMAEKALERSLERHRSLVNGALDSVASAIFIADAEERIVWVNQQAELFFQLSRKSVLGEDRCHVIQHLLAPRVADPDAFERKLREPCAKRSGFVCQIRGNESLQERVLEYRTIPIKSGMYAGGRIEHFYDITRLKETERQLMEAKQSAEVSRAQTRRFLSTVSHEVRTAAAGILGFAELLLEKDLDEEAHYFAKLIENNGRTLLGLLSNVLDLARLETGSPSPEYQAFSPEKCGSQALDAIRSLAVQKNLDIDLHVSEAVPETVLGDPIRLRQVLTNLLSNAVKFTDAGSVAISMDAEEHNGTGEADSDGADLDLLVTVSDTGIGISAEEQEHLFEAFVQAGSDPDRQFGGSGLGLYIVGQLLDVMDGRIALDSTPGSGSSFHLRIPVRSDS